MEIVSENRLVFDEVERMLRALYGEDPAYDDRVFVLGYNVARYTPADLRKRFPGKKVVVYQLEQLFEGSKWANRHTYAWLKGADEVWDYDLSNMEFLRRSGIKAKYAPMSYCEALRDIPASPKEIDVLFYGYPTQRRLRVMSELMGSTWDRFSTVWATGVSGDRLRVMVSRARIVLNVHAFFENCRQEQVRMFYPVINGACVLSENSPHNEFGKAIVEAPVDKLAATAVHILKHGLWEKVGTDAPEVYRKHCGERKG